MYHTHQNGMSEHSQSFVDVAVMVTETWLPYAAVTPTSTYFEIISKVRQKVDVHSPLPLRPLHSMHPRLFIFSPLCLPLALIALSQTALASILAIDYGSDWIKASLIKPGVPFDVLLNRDSKRKIQATVGWKNNDRLFGSDAFNVVSEPHA